MSACSLHRLFHPTPLANALRLTTDAGMSPHSRTHGGQSDNAPGLIALASSITYARNGGLADFHV